MKQLFPLLFAVGCALRTTAGDTTTLKLLFVGDIMGHRTQIDAAYDPSTGNYDYTPCFEFIRPIVQKADIAIGNLELTLTSTPPYTGAPAYKSPDALLKGLNWAGFDMLLSANNHANDGGLQGITHTIEAVKNEQMYHIGAYKNAKEREAYHPLEVYYKDYKLAFLNYTYGTNISPAPAPAVVNLIDEAAIKADLAFAKTGGNDLIVVMMHWGDQYQTHENKAQTQLAEKIFQWGADVIIGSHPHVVQPMKKMNVTMPDGSTKQGLVVYSLGNFVADQEQPNTDGGIMVELTVRKNAVTRKAYVADAAYIPVWRYHDKVNKTVKGGQFYVLPVSPFEAYADNLIGMTATDHLALEQFGVNVRHLLNYYGAKEKKYTLRDIGLKYAGDGGPRRTLKPTISATPPQTAGSTNVEVVAKYKPSASPNPDFVVKSPTATAPASYDWSALTTKPVTTTPANLPGKRPTTPAQTVPAQTVPATGDLKEVQRYRIQIMAAANRYPEDKLPLQNVTVEQGENGWFKYYYGEVETLEQAKNLLVQVQAEGFQNAFIVKFLKKVPADLATGNEPKGNTTPALPINLPGSDVAVKSYDQIAQNTPKGTGAKAYRVQYQSTLNLYTSTIDNIVFEQTEIIQTDGRYRYYCGNYDNYEDAAKMLEYVRNKGFKDAFIVTFQGALPKVK